MKKIAIYGAGGFGRETALLIRQINLVSNEWNLWGFFDDGIQTNKVIDNLPVLGGINDLNELKEPLNLVVAIADPGVRATLVSTISNDHLIYPTIIHSSCFIGDPENQFGKGCILTAGVIMTTGIKLGDFVIVNLRSCIGHDVTCGDFVTIMPGCNVSGNVKIGEQTMVGTGSSILQNLNVGNKCKIGAGAVLITDCYDNKTMVGVPAREK